MGLPYLGNRVSLLYEIDTCRQSMKFITESSYIRFDYISCLGEVVAEFLIFTDDSEDENGSAEDMEDGEDTFMHSYSDALNEELKSTTLEKSFVRANEQAPKKDEVHVLLFCKWR